MSLESWIQTITPPFISAVVAVVVAIWQYGKRKDEEKKVEALKVLLGTVRGWREYIQSVANANSVLRDHIRGKRDDGSGVVQFSSMNDIEAAIDTNGNYLNGLHIGVKKELETIEKVLSGNKKDSC